MGWLIWGLQNNNVTFTVEPSIEKETALSNQGPDVPPIQESILETIGTYQSIQLSDLDRVSLLKRMDSKFVVNILELPKILDQIRNEYEVLEIDSQQLMTYNTIYFDTNVYDFYHQHHNGKLKRAKVRKRLYKISDICFLEVKKKDGKGRTHKIRTPIDRMEFQNDLGDAARDYIKASGIPYVSLDKSLFNSFDRITLSHKKRKERVTIDLDLKFGYNDRKKEFDKLVIIEVKQLRINRASPIFQTLKRMGKHPCKISKYCIGMASLYPEIKYNNFKQKLVRINKLSQ